MIRPFLDRVNKVCLKGRLRFPGSYVVYSIFVGFFFRQLFLTGAVIIGFLASLAYSVYDIPPAFARYTAAYFTHFSLLLKIFHFVNSMGWEQASPPAL